VTVLVDRSRSSGARCRRPCCVSREARCRGARVS
jgi:hypothetical protein